jgi:hypothetical protein
LVEPRTQQQFQALERKVHNETQSTIPRQTHPPACTASVIVGSCRQSVNTHSGAPGFATRRHSLSHSAHQYANERLFCASGPTGSAGGGAQATEDVTSSVLLRAA